MTNETEMKGQLISRSSNSVRFQHDDSDKPVRVVTALIQHLTLSDGTAVIKDGEILVSLNDHKQILTNQQFAHSLFKSGQHLKRFLYLNLAGTVLTISAAVTAEVPDGDKIDWLLYGSGIICYFLAWFEFYDAGNELVKGAKTLDPMVEERHKTK